MLKIDRIEIVIRRVRADEASVLTEISFRSKQYWKYPQKYFDLWKEELTVTREYIEQHDVYVYQHHGQVIGYYAIVEIDKQMEVSGIEITENVTSQYPLTKVIYYTSHVDEQLITQGFEAGAFGYVPKNFKPQELIEAIHMVHDGQKFMKGIVSEKFISSYLKSEKEKKMKQDIPLSEREMEVLQHMSQGLSNKQIADELYISIRTVETHKHNLMKKLNIYSTAELVIYAIQNNIIKI